MVFFMSVSNTNLPPPPGNIGPIDLHGVSGEKVTLHIKDQQSFIVLPDGKIRNVSIIRDRTDLLSLKNLQQQDLSDIMNFLGTVFTKEAISDMVKTNHAYSTFVTPHDTDATQAVATRASPVDNQGSLLAVNERSTLVRAPLDKINSIFDRCKPAQTSSKPTAASTTAATAAYTAPDATKPDQVLKQASFLHQETRNAHMQFYENLQSLCKDSVVGKPNPFNIHDGLTNLKRSSDTTLKYLNDAKAAIAAQLKTNPNDPELTKLQTDITSMIVDINKINENISIALTIGTQGLQLVTTLELAKKELEQDPPPDNKNLSQLKTQLQHLKNSYETVGKSLQQLKYQNPDDTAQLKFYQESWVEEPRKFRTEYESTMSRINSAIDKQLKSQTTQKTVSAESLQPSMTAQPINPDGIYMHAVHQHAQICQHAEEMAKFIKDSPKIMQNQQILHGQINQGLFHLHATTDTAIKSLEASRDALNNHLITLNDSTKRSQALNYLNEINTKIGELNEIKNRTWTSLELGPNILHLQASLFHSIDVLQGVPPPDAQKLSYLKSNLEALGQSINDELPRLQQSNITDPLLSKRKIHMEERWNNPGLLKQNVDQCLKLIDNKLAQGKISEKGSTKELEQQTKNSEKIGELESKIRDLEKSKTELMSSTKESDTISQLNKKISDLEKELTTNKNSKISELEKKISDMSSENKMKEEEFVREIQTLEASLLQSQKNVVTEADETPIQSAAFSFSTPTDASPPPTIVETQQLIKEENGKLKIRKELLNTNKKDTEEIIKKTSWEAALSGQEEVDFEEDLTQLKEGYSDYIRALDTSIAKLDKEMGRLISVSQKNKDPSPKLNEDLTSLTKAIMQIKQERASALNESNEIDNAHKLGSTVLQLDAIYDRIMPPNSKNLDTATLIDITNYLKTVGDIVNGQITSLHDEGMSDSLKCLSLMEKASTYQSNLKRLESLIESRQASAKPATAQIPTPTAPPPPATPATPSTQKTDIERDILLNFLNNFYQQALAENSATAGKDWLIPIGGQPDALAKLNPRAEGDTRLAVLGELRLTELNENAKKMEAASKAIVALTNGESSELTLQKAFEQMQEVARNPTLQEMLKMVVDYHKYLKKVRSDLESKVKGNNLVVNERDAKMLRRLDREIAKCEAFLNTHQDGIKTLMALTPPPTTPVSKTPLMITAPGEDEKPDIGKLATTPDLTFSTFALESAVSLVKDLYAMGSMLLGMINPTGGAGKPAMIESPKPASPTPTPTITKPPQTPTPTKPLSASDNIKLQQQLAATTIGQPLSKPFAATLKQNIKTDQPATPTKPVTPATPAAKPSETPANQTITATQASAKQQEVDKAVEATKKQIEQAYSTPHTNLTADQKIARMTQYLDIKKDLDSFKAQWAKIKEPSKLDDEFKKSIGDLEVKLENLRLGLIRDIGQELYPNPAEINLLKHDFQIPHTGTKAATPPLSEKQCLELVAGSMAFGLIGTEERRDSFKEDANVLITGLSKKYPDVYKKISQDKFFQFLESTSKAPDTASAAPTIGATATSTPQPTPAKPIVAPATTSTPQPTVKPSIPSQPNINAEEPTKAKDPVKIQAEADSRVFASKTSWIVADSESVRAKLSNIPNNIRSITQLEGSVLSLIDLENKQKILKEELNRHEKNEAASAYNPQAKEGVKKCIVENQSVIDDSKKKIANAIRTCKTSVGEIQARKDMLNPTSSFTNNSGFMAGAFALFGSSTTKSKPDNQEGCKEILLRSMVQGTMTDDGNELQNAKKMRDNLTTNFPTFMSEDIQTNGLYRTIQLTFQNKLNENELAKSQAASKAGSPSKTSTTTPTATSVTTPPPQTILTGTTPKETAPPTTATKPPSKTETAKPPQAPSTTTTSTAPTATPSAGTTTATAVTPTATTAEAKPAKPAIPTAPPPPQPTVTTAPQPTVTAMKPGETKAETGVKQTIPTDTQTTSTAPAKPAAKPDETQPKVKAPTAKPAQKPPVAAKTTSQATTSSTPSASTAPLKITKPAPKPLEFPPTAKETREKLKGAYDKEKISTLKGEDKKGALTTSVDHSRKLLGHLMDQLSSKTDDISQLATELNDVDELIQAAKKEFPEGTMPMKTKLNITALESAFVLIKNLKNISNEKGIEAQMYNIKNILNGTGT